LCSNIYVTTTLHAVRIHTLNGGFEAVSLEILSNYTCRQQCQQR
jgi:hypothetical protein